MTHQEKLRKKADERARFWLHQRFGRLVVINIGDIPSYGRPRKFGCQCDCGNKHSAALGALRGGSVQSCGCLLRENFYRLITKHNRAGTPEHEIWKSMRQRCSNPRNKRYADYGGRGIKVCERWSIFENFLADMGERPSADLSLDRINNDGDYEPGNCRWATKLEQRHNQRRSIASAVENPA